MTVDIIIRFPDEKTADLFCSQMSDGFGENFCDFSYHKQKEGTTGNKMTDYESVTEYGKRVYFVNSIFDF